MQLVSARRKVVRGTCFTDFSGAMEARVLTQAHLALRYAKERLLIASISVAQDANVIGHLACIVQITKAAFLDAILLYESVPLVLTFNQDHPPAVGFMWLEEGVPIFCEFGGTPRRIRSENISVIAVFISRCPQ
jgi:hypothetical protein